MDRWLHRSRRAFIKDGALYMLSSLAMAAGIEHAASGFDGHPALKVGIVTDTHYADTPDRGARNYRTSLDKMASAVDQLNRKRIDFAVHGGDLIDALPAPTPESERGFLRRINQELTHLKAERHYVLGNHCVYSLTKAEYLETVGQPKPFYSFDHGGFHFVILDACCRKDGVDYGRRNFDWRDTEVPAPQRDWLAQDLAATKRRTLVWVHQRIDHPADPDDGVYSAAAVRDILEKSGKVIAVFMGHSHVNDYQTINGIHYCTLDAIVGGAGGANNAYSVLEVYRDGTLKLDGFAKHAANPLTRGEPTTA